MRPFNPVHLTEQTINLPLHNLTVRPAHAYDNTEEIASLLYLTDPFIYPSWFSGCSKIETNHILSRLIMSPGSMFYWDGIVVATTRSSTNPTKEKIIGVFNAIEPPLSRYDYDYSKYKELSPAARHAIEHYVEPLQQEARNAPEGTIFFTNICTHPDYLHFGIARHIMQTCLIQAKLQNYTRIELDCLADNHAILNLHHSLGFQIDGHGTGYAGAGETPPDIFHLHLDLRQ